MGEIILLLGISFINFFQQSKMQRINLKNQRLYGFLQLWFLTAPPLLKQFSLDSILYSWNVLTLYIPSFLFFSSFFFFYFFEVIIMLIEYMIELIFCLRVAFNFLPYLLICLFAYSWNCNLLMMICHLKDVLLLLNVPPSL